MKGCHFCKRISGAKNHQLFNSEEKQTKQQTQKINCGALHGSDD